MTTPTRTTRGAGWWTVLVVSGLVHLAIGYVYLASGLIAPVPVVVALVLWWLLLSSRLVHWALRRSWWIVAVPVVGVISWLVVVELGAYFFGWTA